MIAVQIVLIVQIVQDVMVTAKIFRLCHLHLHLLILRNLNLNMYTTVKMYKLVVMKQILLIAVQAVVIVLNMTYL